MRSFLRPILTAFLFLAATLPARAQVAPAIEFTEPGAALTLTSPEKGALTLESPDATVLLESKWRKSEDTGFTARCTLPSDIQPGVYQVRLDSDGASLSLNTTLHVFPESPEHLRLWINTPPESPSNSETFTPDILLDFNGAATPSAIPSIPLSPSTPPNTLPLGIRIGETNLLIFDINDHSNRALGQLHLLRRRLKNKPVTLAISITPPRDIPFRAQSILFVDDPVQALIFPPDTPDITNLTPLRRWSLSLPIINTAQISRIEISPEGILPK